MKKAHPFGKALLLYILLIIVACQIAVYWTSTPEDQDDTMIGWLISKVPNWVTDSLSLREESYTEINVICPAPDKETKKLLEALRNKGVTPLRLIDLKCSFTSGKTYKDREGIPSLSNEQELYAYLDNCILKGADKAYFRWTSNRSLPNTAKISNSIEYYLTGYNHRQIPEMGKDVYEISLLYSDFYRMLRAVNESALKDTNYQQWLRLTPEELEALHKALRLVNEAITRKGMSKEERALAILKKMVPLITYHELRDSKSVFYMNRNKFVIYATGWGAGKQGNAICEGYAQTYGFCLTLAGIKSLSISGICNRTNSDDYGYHAWNYVQMDDGWYHVDPTWCDNGNEIDFNWFKRTHKALSDKNRAWQGIHGFPKEYGFPGQADLPPCGVNDNNKIKR